MRPARLPRLPAPRLPAPEAVVVEGKPAAQDVLRVLARRVVPAPVT